jgi:hypothetical protein
MVVHELAVWYFGKNYLNLSYPTWFRGIFDAL